MNYIKNIIFGFFIAMAFNISAMNNNPTMQYMCNGQMHRVVYHVEQSGGYQLEGEGRKMEIKEKNPTIHYFYADQKNDPSIKTSSPNNPSPQKLWDRIQNNQQTWAQTQGLKILPIREAAVVQSESQQTQPMPIQQALPIQIKQTPPPIRLVANPNQ